MDTLIPDVNAAGELAVKEGKSKNGEIQYSEEIIVFLDVLGYSNFVMNDKAEAGKVHEIIEFLTKSFKFVTQEHNGEFTIFSDTIVLSFEAKEESKQVLNQLVSDIGVALYRILEKSEYLLRGIVTSGKIYHKENIFFGPGIIEAYRKEKEEILFPRVLLDKSVHSGIDFNKVYKTENHTISIDYISAYIASKPDKKNEIFEVHKKLIEAGLKNKEASIVAKYVWLKDYHNWAVEKYFGNDADKEGLLIVRATPDA
jgi:hypothetical protein